MIGQERSTKKNIEVIQDKRKEIYGAGIFTILVILVLVVGAIRPSVATILRIRTEIAEKKVVNEQLASKLTAIGKLTAQFTQFEDSMRDLQLIYPNTQDFSYIMANIESTAVASNFELVAVGFTPSSVTSELPLTLLKPTSVNITVNGKRDSLIQFLKNLEAMPMYPVIDQVSYENAPDDQGNLQFTLSMTIYEIQEPLFYE